MKLTKLYNGKELPDYSILNNYHGSNRLEVLNKLLDICKESELEGISIVRLFILLENRKDDS